MENGGFHTDPLAPVRCARVALYCEYIQYACCLGQRARAEEGGSRKARVPT